MKLLALTLTNFKGASALTIAAGEYDIDVYGDNGAGKTTIADAISWLLFDKDSLGRKDFEIKPVDPLTQKTIERISPEVEGSFSLSGKTVTFKKRLVENWVTKRGSAAQEFSGHTTHYFVNDVPCQKKEYDDRIASICPEKQFRQLVDPFFFNDDDRNPWTERRKILLEICGDVSDEQVIASRMNLAPLTKILAERSIDEHKKILAARKPKIAHEMELVPTRIDEIRRTLSTKETPVDTKYLSELVAQLQQERTTIQSGGQIAELTKQLRESESESLAIANRLRSQANSGADQHAQAIQAKRSELNAANSEVQQIELAITNLDRQIKTNEAERLGKKGELETERAKEFKWEGATECYACGQALPASKVDEARSRALADFNQKTAAEQERIITACKQIKSAIEIATNAKAQQEEKLAELKAKADALTLELSQIEAQSPTATTVDVEANPEYKAELQKQADLKGQIAQLGESSSTAISEVDSKIAQARANLDAANQTNARIAQAAESQKRVEELEAEQKKLATEFESVSAELFLIEEFIRAKVSLLTDKINSKFKIARFKLFHQQVNGGIEECCICQVNGVPFGSLNHGTRLNVGLDIIDTLSEHFGFAPPVAIDNAESVTSIIPTRGQQIRLIVSANDKALRIETAGQKEKVPA